MQTMQQTLYIIRGLPGSGKTTLANKIVEANIQQNNNAILVEADQFFTVTTPKGEEYYFDRRLLGAAHDECFGRAMRYLFNGYTVCVANTFSTQREINRYYQGIKRAGIECDFRVVRCRGEHKSVHGVPARTIERMQQRWQDWPTETTFNGELNA